MKPCGIIETYMSREDFKGQSFWVKVRTLFFNLCLFVFQLIFMVVGKILGKVKVKWRRVWRAAQCSHVRLCLRLAEAEWYHYSFMVDYPTYDYINFGWEYAEIQPWRMDMIDDSNGRFKYFDPTFPTPPEFMESVIQYAEDQVGKGYDDLQLVSSGLHIIAWIVYPWKWGKEIKIIKALNRKGGREHCISGMTACLRWGNDIAVFSTIPHHNYISFFERYDTAVVLPCLAAIDENWEESK